MTFRRRLASKLRALATRRDPPPRDHGDDELAAVDRHLELWALVDAGRIQRRAGESTRALSRRLTRGDFEIVDNLIDFNTERARRAHRKAAGQ